MERNDADDDNNDDDDDMDDQQQQQMQPDDDEGMMMMVEIQNAIDNVNIDHLPRPIQQPQQPQQLPQQMGDQMVLDGLDGGGGGGGGADNAPQPAAAEAGVVVAGDNHVQQQQQQRPRPRRENRIPQLLVDHPAVIAFQQSNASFLVTDPNLPGNPIIYASDAFLELTGYPVERVLGRNCRFLQGPRTDPMSIATMREAIDRGENVMSRVLNYRWDGTTFWNEVLISGVQDPERDDRSIVYYLGLQRRVDGDDPEEERENDGGGGGGGGDDVGDDRLNQG